jgi:hypothetical protein
MRNLGIVVLGAALGGCASSAADIAPAYVSPVAYQSYTCQQLALEAQSISTRAATLSGAQDKQRTNDVLETRSAQRSCDGYLFKRSTSRSGQKMFARSGCQKRMAWASIPTAACTGTENRSRSSVGASISHGHRQLSRIAVAIFTALGALGTMTQSGISYHDRACRNKEPSTIACPMTVDTPVPHRGPDSD